jgi:dihydrofolate synthase / folylpolyglutamate synthase
VLDVAHNPHAAAVLAQNLDNQGFFPATRAVFGMLSDKDVTGVVGKVRDRVDRWYLASTPGARGLDQADLRGRVIRAGVADNLIASFATLEAAYAAALDESEPDDRIIVFGSFMTVAAVLRTRAG